MSPTAAEHLKDEVKRALHLLHDLTEHNPPAEPLGKLQPALVKHCKVRLGCCCIKGTVEKAFGRQLDTLLLPWEKLNQQGQQRAWTSPWTASIAVSGWPCLVSAHTHTNFATCTARLPILLDNLLFCVGEGYPVS